ncbi:hypothetical protein DWB77_07389 [Streptomyces hundungensis]|uniref:Uncharacterized protein n=1 Tax=Streptomyces hundungensis TaxID=1077946 RepID=A0A387HSL7_9ACTN|nr:hypothetical protein [Streptomyces hundungensis]AYG85172.1 hypothetical protein DWB77_07389 [Streptomyces hundungensis]
MAKTLEQTDEAERQASFVRLVELRQAFLAPPRSTMPLLYKPAAAEDARMLRVHRFEFNDAVTKAAHSS